MPEIFLEINKRYQICHRNNNDKDEESRSSKALMMMMMMITSTALRTQSQRNPFTSDMTGYGDAMKILLVTKQSIETMRRSRFRDTVKETRSNKKHSLAPRAKLATLAWAVTSDRAHTHIYIYMYLHVYINVCCAGICLVKNF